ncbi:hypothetical protein COO58_03830 [Micromonospora sp. WMMA1996]|nr:hypothetical protein COO58_03830 [Micromonospora sp. WMMA1996]
MTRTGAAASSPSDARPRRPSIQVAAAFAGQVGLDASDAISRGRWGDAQGLVAEHKGMTGAGQRLEWARAIGDRQTSVTDPVERTRPQNLVDAVVDC